MLLLVSMMIKLGHIFQTLCIASVRVPMRSRHFITVDAAVYATFVAAVSAALLVAGLV